MSCLFSGCGQFGFISQDTQDGTEAAELNFVWCHRAEVGRSMRNLGAFSEQGSGTPPNWNSTSTRSVDNSWCHKHYKCPQSVLSCQILAPIPMQGSDKTMLWFACQLGMGIVKAQGSMGPLGTLPCWVINHSHCSCRGYIPLMGVTTTVPHGCSNEYSSPPPS